MTDKPLTGRKFFLIFAAFFGVIIAVNVMLAVKAVSTFPGLETRNTYIASQQFDAARAAQTSLGWEINAIVDGSMLTLTITDAQGASVTVADISAILGRPTHDRDDQVLDLAISGAGYVSPVQFGPGVWNLRVKAVALDGTGFYQRIVVRAGA
ncbi:MAG: FixH family protein [Paracoccaceae bacterium]